MLTLISMMRLFCIGLGCGLLAPLGSGVLTINITSAMIHPDDKVEYTKPADVDLKLSTLQDIKKYIKELNYPNITTVRRCIDEMQIQYHSMIAPIDENDNEK